MLVARRASASLSPLGGHGHDPVRHVLGRMDDRDWLVTDAIRHVADQVGLGERVVPLSRPHHDRSCDTGDGGRVVDAGIPVHVPHAGGGRGHRPRVGDHRMVVAGTTLGLAAPEQGADDAVITT